jgi:riboflavin transporter FmnP
MVKALLQKPISISNLLDISLIPQLFANLILGFVIGITLMRKKDVQPFLTVEDFWGGILLGFLVGYTGQQLFEQISNISLNRTSGNITNLS